jgi:hypothetical protein
MLFLASPIVAPLRPVDDDGWFFWDDDLEGTCKSPRSFLDSSSFVTLESMVG